MVADLYISHAGVDSNRPPHRSGLSECVAHPGQRANLDLTGALSRETEHFADLVERLRWLTESVVGSDDSSLAFSERGSDVTHLLHLHLVKHVLEGLLGNGIDNRVADRRGCIRLSPERVFEAAWRSLGRLEALELREREAGRIAQLVVGGFRAVSLQIVPACRPELGESSDCTVGQGHGPRQLRDELLHGLTH